MTQPTQTSGSIAVADPRDIVRRREQLAEGRGLVFPALGFEALDLHGGDRLVDQVFDRRQRFALVGTDEHEGHAVLAHPAGPADPVEVILGVVGDIEVNHVADAFHVVANNSNSREILTYSHFSIQ